MQCWRLDRYQPDCCRIEHTVGLKSDGTVVAVGNNNYGQCNAGSWTDIIQIAAGFCHTVGVKSDGTVVVVGLNVWGQCDVNNWNSCGCGVEQLWPMRCRQLDINCLSFEYLLSRC